MWRDSVSLCSDFARTVSYLDLVRKSHIPLAETNLVARVRREREIEGFTGNEMMKRN